MHLFMLVDIHAKYLAVSGDDGHFMLTRGIQDIPVSPCLQWEEFFRKKGMYCSR